MTVPGRVYPDVGAVAGSDLWQICGAALTVVLILACLMVIIGATAWGLAHATGHPAVASRARTGMLVAAGAAVLAGATNAWIGFLLTFGGTL